MTHQLRQAGIPVGFSVLEKAQVAAARSSTGVEEGDDSRIKEQLGKEDVEVKTHQAALGGGKSVYLNLNDSSLSQQPVDLLTVDRMRVCDGVVGGGVALNVHSKGLNSIVGLNSTAGSTVDHSERQLLQQQQQHSTVQGHPLTRGGPAQISGGGDAVGVQQQHSTVLYCTGLT